MFLFLFVIHRVSSDIDWWLTTVLGNSQLITYTIFLLHYPYPLSLELHLHVCKNFSLCAVRRNNCIMAFCKFCMFHTSYRRKAQPQSDLSWQNTTWSSPGIQKDRQSCEELSQGHFSTTVLIFRWLPIFQEAATRQLIIYLHGSSWIFTFCTHLVIAGDYKATYLQLRKYSLLQGNPLFVPSVIWLPHFRVI